MILVQFSAFAQGKKLFILDKENHYLLADSSSIVIHDNSGSTIVYYNRDLSEQSGIFNRWPSFEEYPEKIILKEFLNTYNFKKVGIEVDAKLLQYEIILLDSTKGEMKPCGQALEADHVMFYNYISRIIYKDKILFECKQETFSFYFNFDKSGFLKELKRTSQIWEDHALNLFYIYTSKGFTITKQ